MANANRVFITRIYLCQKNRLFSGTGGNFILYIADSSEMIKLNIYQNIYTLD